MCENVCVCAHVIVCVSTCMQNALTSQSMGYEWNVSDVGEGERREDVNACVSRFPLSHPIITCASMSKRCVVMVFDSLYPNIG